MKPTSQKILFFGTEDFSATTLQRLIDDGYNIAAVITKPDMKKGRGQKLVQPIVKKIALEHNIPVWQPIKLMDIADSITKMRPVAGVLVSYGKIIPQKIIDLFSPGIINIHPSLLPMYRGPSPIESAINNGDTKTGVSIMQLSAAMDAGPVYDQLDYHLSGNETRPELYLTLGNIGASRLSEILPDILSGNIAAIPQDDNQASYCHLLSKEDAYMDPSQHTAAEIERHIRAHLGFPKTRLPVLGSELIITSARVSSEKNTPLDIKCRDGAYISIDELVAPSGRSMSAHSFLNGYLSKP